MSMTRRDLLRNAALTTVAASAGWSALEGVASAAGSPYGPPSVLGPEGLWLPPGFSARVLVREGQQVAGTGFVWPGEPDGSATFPTDDGWIYVGNSELNGTNGGAAAIRLDRAGEPVDAYRILGGTKYNCTGGTTPWGTWLSCEEYRQGRIWECDPLGRWPGVERPALGTRPHEAAPVHPATGFVYMTEDDYDARIYRFRPFRRGNLSAGVLEAASVAGDGRVTWIRVSGKQPDRSRTTTAFQRPEGAWIFQDVFYFATTTDERVWALDLRTMVLRVIYDAATAPSPAPLRDPDNLTIHEPTGRLFVGEDDGDLRLVALVPEAGGAFSAHPFLRLDPATHAGSEVTGPSFSPDGRRLYVTSQRGPGGVGVIYEVTGPFGAR